MILTMQKTIGILGGMGPDASVRLYQMMIELAWEKYGASSSDEYPEILINNVPVPDFFDDPSKVDDGVFLLKSRVRALSRLNLDCLAMACNTAHTTMVDLQTETKVPFVELPVEVAEYIARDGYGQVGLLATPLTVHAGVYDVPLRERGVEVVNPTEEELSEIGKTVHEVLAGKFKDGKMRLLKVADRMKRSGAEAIVLGCTELPLIFPGNYSLKTYNSLQILAQSLLKRYYRK